MDKSNTHNMREVRSQVVIQTEGLNWPFMDYTLLMAYLLKHYKMLPKAFSTDCIWIAMDNFDSRSISAIGLFYDMQIDNKIQLHKCD